MTIQSCAISAGSTGSCSGFQASTRGTDARAPRLARGGPAGPPPPEEPFEQRRRGEAIGAVDARAGDLARGLQVRERRAPVERRPRRRRRSSAPRAPRERARPSDRSPARGSAAPCPGKRAPDPVGRLVRDVEEDVRLVALEHPLVDGAGDDVARRELAGRVRLAQELLARRRRRSAPPRRAGPPRGAAAPAARRAPSGGTGCTRDSGAARRRAAPSRCRRRARRPGSSCGDRRARVLRSRGSSRARAAASPPRSPLEQVRADHGGRADSDRCPRRSRARASAGRPPSRRSSRRCSFPAGRPRRAPLDRDAGLVLDVQNARNRHARPRASSESPRRRGRTARRARRSRRLWTRSGPSRGEQVDRLGGAESVARLLDVFGERLGPCRRRAARRSLPAPRTCWTPRGSPSG